MDNMREIPIHTPIIIESPREAVVNFYNVLYRQDSSDSPEESKTSIANRAADSIRMLSENDIVLDLGSGPQVLAKMLLQKIGNKEDKPQIITVDFAEIPYRNLRGRNYPQISQVRADGNFLPFPDNTFSMVISNMALDFMGEEAIQELERVTKPGSKLVINLHHPFLLENREVKKPSKNTVQKMHKTIFYDFLRKNKTLAGTIEEVENKFKNSRLKVSRVRLNHYENDQWWEVDMVKP